MQVRVSGFDLESFGDTLKGGIVKGKNIVCSLSPTLWLVLRVYGIDCLKLFEPK